MKESNEIRSMIFFIFFISRCRFISYRKDTRLTPETKRDVTVCIVYSNLNSDFQRSYPFTHIATNSTQSSHILSYSIHSNSINPKTFLSAIATTSFPMSQPTRSPFYTPLLAIVLPVTVAAILFQLEPFQPVALPIRLDSVVVVPARNDHARVGSEAVAVGHVEGPEDLAYDAASRVVYTGCEDGWIKRVTVNDSAVDSVVENWINTGGRPLGLTLLQSGELIVADAGKVLSC